MTGRCNVKNSNSKIQGFTVLEVIVALFIFGCVSAALLKAVVSADRIHGRALTVMSSTIIAENEIERIRNKASFLETVEDCTFVTMVRSREFEVKRHILVQENDLFLGDINVTEKEDNSLLQIEISVKETSQPDSNALKLRFLQGYSW